MNLQIAKWGNSLAVRIPAAYARQTGLKEGDQVQSRINADGSLSICPAAWDRKAFAAELQQSRENMPIGDSVMEELRRGGRY